MDSGGRKCIGNTWYGICNHFLRRGRVESVVKRTSRQVDTHKNAHAHRPTRNPRARTDPHARTYAHIDPQIRTHTDRQIHRHTDTHSAVANEEFEDVLLLP